MPQTIKTTNSKEIDAFFDEKENKKPDFNQKKRRNVRKLTKVRYKETDSKYLSNSFSALSESVAELKPLGFWSKKLKDLEENIKTKKSEFYEFSTDESESSYKRKKRPKPKPKPRIKKQPPIPNPFKLTEKTNKIPKPGSKTKKIHEHSLCREQIILSKERQKLADKGEKFTFTTELSSLGITSTPAVKRDNLVGSSNFLFLSPINNEEVKCCVNTSVENEAAFNGKDLPLMYLGQETPKMAKMNTKLKRKSCRRVLRSGKMLNK